MLPIMEEDQDVLLYFNVLDFRHKIMLENLNESKLLFKKLELEKEGIEKTDALLQYYFSKAFWAWDSEKKCCLIL